MASNWIQGADLSEYVRHKLNKVCRDANKSTLTEVVNKLPISDSGPSAGNEVGTAVSKLPGGNEPTHGVCFTEAESKNWEQLYNDKLEECSELRRLLSEKSDEHYKFEKLCSGLKEALKCIICTDCLKKPTTLPCGHTFCYKCIKKWKKKREAGVRRKTCPMCRNPKKGLTSVKVVNDVVKIVTEVEKENKKEENNDVARFGT